MTAEVIGYILAIFVGISLGLIGSGGSILTVPILVYVMAVEPVLATAYSLFVVGVTSLVGGLQNARQKKVDFKTIVVFGVPSIASVYLARACLMPLIPDRLFSVGDFEFTKPMALMTLFAIVMISASISMIKPCDHCTEDESEKINYNYFKILLQGVSVGILTGLVGAGGGFLIIPSLIFFAAMPLRKAIGTSLFIIASNSLVGFIGVLVTRQPLDWALLLAFSALSIAGIFIGIFLSKKMEGNKLKTAFGWFVLLMGIYILIKELLL